MGAGEILAILASVACGVSALVVVAKEGNEDIRRSLDETYEEGSQD